MIIKKYEINIDIDTNKYIYHGYVKIFLDINKTKKIKLNCKDINILNVKVNNVNYDYSIDNKKDLLIINKSLIKNNYELLINFENKIKEDLDGFYYVREDDKLFLCTHFEPSSARTFIPCFDKPKYKSEFNVTITFPNNYNALSNMDIYEEFTNNFKKTIQFNTTPKMSIYLLCIVIGDFVPLLDKPFILNDTKINCYCLEKHKKLLEFSLKYCIEGLNYYEKLFKIKYPLPKLDFIAIPEFLAGAMENWGLITFREESLLLYDNTDDFQKRRIIEVIYHEIVHQWFGNLVTLKDWKHLWLNESNATYFSNFALNNLNKKYKNEIISTALMDNRLFKRDAMNNTNPIIPEEFHNENNLFNEITYDKGCKLINYISNLMSEVIFQNSINEFLNNYKYECVDSSKIYEYFDKLSNKNINYNKLINDLINVKGYPIIEINYKNNNFVLTKKKFNLNKNIIENFNCDFYFDIKINDEINTYHFNTDNLKINSNNTIIPNPNNYFFCIINWKDITPPINLMNEIEIIRLINDNSILYIYGYIPFENYIKILNSIIKIINYDNYIIIFNIMININKLFKLYKLTQNNNNKLLLFVKQNREFFEKYFIYLIKNNVLYTELIINELLILFCINLEEKQFINIAINLFKNQGDNKIFSNSLFKIINKYNFKEKNIILKKNLNNKTINSIIESYEYIDKNYFKFIINNIEIIKKQNYINFFVSLSNNIILQKEIVTYYFDNIDKLNVNNYLKENIILNMAEFVYDKILFDEIVNFINKQNDFDKIIKNKIIEILELNILIKQYI